MRTKVNIFWFRRDLRLEDNHGLHHALNSGLPILPIFIFDKNILVDLQKNDPRITFIYEALTAINQKLIPLGKRIRYFHDTPSRVFEQLTVEYDIQELYYNEDYEPYAIQRDSLITEKLRQQSIHTHTFTDHVLFHPGTIKKNDGTPYLVFTPYSNKWKRVATEFNIPFYTSTSGLNNFLDIAISNPTLEALGFIHNKKTSVIFSIKETVISDYHKTRDFPGIGGTSKLSTHLRFGTVSIRSLIQTGIELNEKWLNELIWREFYQMVLFYFPESVSQSIKSKYDNIPWSNNEDHFKLWCTGKTGIPFVDAGMRELNETGFMHNRLRMITASFLTKNLLIDWRWGERYFAEKLMDFELASNVGGWQWASGSGCDASPYFRVFNPDSQHKKFDPQSTYTRQWVPEFNNPFEYTPPIVDLKSSRARAISIYKSALNIS